MSSLGKGIIAASLAKLLQARGLRVTIQKFDPYINIDPGTLNPYEHGECYVTDDGAETDLDLGHYERFLGVPTSQANNVTTGKELSYEETAALSDKGLSNAQAEVIAAINELFDDMAQNGAPNKIIEQARSSSISEENLSKVKYYFNGEGKLTAAFRYTGVAGASDYGEIAVLSNEFSSQS